MRPLKIRLRDVNRNYIGRISAFAEATFIPKWNGVGSWSIKFAGNSPGAAMFVPGCGINVELPDGSDFSGHATNFIDEWDSDNNPGSGLITISGVEDTALLGYRCVLPNPASDYTTQTASATYTLNGPAETLIKTVVNANLGPGALAQRILPGLQINPDRGGGNVGTLSARYDNLLDLVQRTASPINMGFKLKSVAGGWVFDTSLSDDVSANVRFSRASGNLTSWTFGEQAPTITRALVAGAGSGVARNIQVYDQAAGALDPEWGLMIENFLDHRDTSLSSDLLAAANDAFASGSSQASFTVGVVDTEKIQIGRDYRLGSIVSVDIRGEIHTEPITEIAYTFQADQFRITPTLGGADAVHGQMLNLFRVVKSIASRVALLERRY